MVTVWNERRGRHSCQHTVTADSDTCIGDCEPHLPTRSTALPAPMTVLLTDARRQAPERRLPRRRPRSRHSWVFSRGRLLFSKKGWLNRSRASQATGAEPDIARGRAWGEQVAQAVLAWRGRMVVHGSAGLTLVALLRVNGVRSRCTVRARCHSMPCFVAFHDEQFIPIPARPAPALDSPQYAADVNEVKAIGRVDSAIRTASQTELSLLWAAILRSMKTRWPARGAAPLRVGRHRPVLRINHFAACDGMIAGFDASTITVSGVRSTRFG